MGILSRIGGKCPLSAIVLMMSWLSLQPVAGSEKDAAAPRAR